MKPMKKGNHLVWTLLTLGLLLIFSGYGNAQPSVKLRVAYVAPIGVMAPVWMAAESGAFQRENLNVDLKYIAPSSAVPALLANEVDALEISAPGIIPAILAGANVTMIAGLLDKMIFSLHAQNDIKTPDQLRDKVVGTDREGTPTDYGARVALNKLGLNPKTDVRLLHIGNSAVLMPALQSGQIAAATLTPPQSFKADKLGFTRLVNTYELPYQNIGVVIQKSHIEQRSDDWLRLLRAVQQGIYRWYDDPKLAKEVLTKYTKEADPEQLQQTYDFFSKQAGFNKDLTLNEEGIRVVLNFMGSTTLPSARNAVPRQIYDTRILEKLKK
jgi:ABC-type nitrate/sulfonate/bicarbonate transport system substrate-binding protein